MYSSTKFNDSNLVYVGHEINPDSIFLFFKGSTGSTALTISNDDMLVHKEAMLSIAETIEAFYKDVNLKDKMKMQELEKGLR